MPDCSPRQRAQVSRTGTGGTLSQCSVQCATVHPSSSKQKDTYKYMIFQCLAFEQHVYYLLKLSLFLCSLIMLIYFAHLLCSFIYLYCIVLYCTVLHCIALYCIVLYCIVLYCIISIHLYSASCSAHQSEALPMRETQREESSLERTKKDTWLTSK